MPRTDLVWLAKILYPQGRAFRMPYPIDDTLAYTTEDGSEEYTTEDGSESYTAEDSPASTGGIFYRVHRALSTAFNDAWDAGDNVLDVLMPDNPNFSIEDAHAWYRRLGLYDSGLVSFADMKLAIAQKQSFPLVPLDKQHYLYIQAQLQAAGFDVYVYPNRFFPGPVTKDPSEVLGVSAGDAVYDAVDYDDTEYDGSLADLGITVIANYLEEAKDAEYVFGDNLRSTFYIAGSTITTFADVPEVRKIEFRQLIMKLKRAETAGFLFINYT